jgi:hypothetical protein
MVRCVIILDSYHLVGEAYYLHLLGSQYLSQLTLYTKIVCVLTFKWGGGGLLP